MSDQLRETYDQLFSDLKDWIVKKKADFEVCFGYEQSFFASHNSIAS